MVYRAFSLLVVRSLWLQFIESDLLFLNLTVQSKQIKVGYLDE